MIEGTKTLLAEMKTADLPTIHAWRNDPAVAEFLPFLQRSLADLNGWFGLALEKPDSAYFVISTLERKEIGYVGFRDIDWPERTATLEIVIGDKSYWGQGYGADAIVAAIDFGIEDLGLVKIRLSVLPFNERALRAYERVGFRRVGFLTEFVFRNNKLWKPILMQLTKEQFSLKKKMAVGLPRQEQP